MADLSALPLLRLDQLVQLDAATLDRSLEGLNGLVLLGGGSNQTAQQYVARQRQAIERELERRRMGRPPAGPCQVWREIGPPTGTAASNPKAPPPKSPPAAALKARHRAPAAGPVKFVVQAAPRRVVPPSSPSVRPPPLTTLKRRRREALERLQRFMEARRQAERCEAPSAAAPMLDRSEKGEDGAGWGASMPVECEAEKAAAAAKEPDKKDGMLMLLPAPPPAPAPAPLPVMATDCDCLAAFPTLASLVLPHPPPTTGAPLSAAQLEQADRILRQHLAEKREGAGAVYVELGTASRPEVVAIVADVLRERLPGWRPLLPVEDGDKGETGTSSSRTWNVLWSWGRPRLDHGALLAFQRVNHIPNSRQLTRKDLLARHLDRLLGPSSSSVMPRTFALPQDYTAFVACFAASSRKGGRARSSTSSTSTASTTNTTNTTTSTSGRNNVWIIKPVESSRGRGIRLVDDVAQVLYTEPSVIQRYVPDPLLLRGRYKFDLRLYVLVTAFQPRLEAFIYREGFARLCTRPFTLDCLTDPLVHLSNSSVQRRALRGHGAAAATMAEDHPLQTAPAAHVGGSKLRLNYLLKLLQQEEHGGGVNPTVVWERIKALVLTSLVAVADSVPASAHGFELFGYDVLLDAALRPWILEVNASPSMAREHPLDAEVKEALIHDTLCLVDPVPWDRLALPDVLVRGLGPAGPCSIPQHQSGRRQHRPRAAVAGGARLYPNAALSVEELHRILGGRHRPRQQGEEVPSEQLGQYERLSPDMKLHQQTVANKRRGKQQQKRGQGK